MILLNIHMQIYCRRDSRGIDVQFDLTSLPALFVARYNESVIRSCCMFRRDYDFCC